MSSPQGGARWLSSPQGVSKPVAQLLDTVRTFDGILILEPGPGGAFPELAWGDKFFYYSPSGTVPQNVQPYGTIVVKDYPDEPVADLAPDRARVNMQVDRDTFVRLIGVEPRSLGDGYDYSTADQFFPHPAYGPMSWVSVIEPTTTMDAALELLRTAHAAARARAERREPL